LDKERHEHGKLSKGDGMLGDLAEPNTPQGFVHTTERFTETVDGVKRFLISPALTDVFLPARKQIMEEFLGNRLESYRNPDDPIGGRRVH
jgi:hypothetical protein